MSPKKKLQFFKGIPLANMEQTQLVELIRTLEKSEKELILQFAGLPVLNNGKMKAFVPRLLQICLSHSWNDIKENLDKKTVFSKLFPNQDFVEGKLEKIMVEANKIVRTALLFSHYLRDENEFQQGFDFSEILKFKGLELRYRNQLLRLQKLQDNFDYKEAKFYKQQLQLENAIHEFECYYNHKKGDLNVPKLIQVLEINFQLNRISILNRLLLQQKFSKIEIPASLIPRISEIVLPNNYLNESPILNASYAIFKLLIKEQPTLSDIRSFFDLLNYTEKDIDSENLQEFYTYLRNICILVYSYDVEKTELEIMLNVLYKDNLNRGYLHYQGKLHPSRYWAVSSNAVRVKDFEWAKTFIERYKNELIGENETQDIYRLNLANYLFGIGKFSECLDNIPSSSPYVDYLLTGKRLEIKAYYELKSDLLPYKLEAFKVFLSRTSPKLLSESQRQIHSDFVNLLTQIHTSIAGDQKRADKIISRIQEKKQAAEWRWLLEKAQALKTK